MTDPWKPLDLPGELVSDYLALSLETNPTSHVFAARNVRLASRRCIFVCMSLKGFFYRWMLCANGWCCFTRVPLALWQPVIVSRRWTPESECDDDLFERYSIPNPLPIPRKYRVPQARAVTTCHRELSGWLTWWQRWMWFRNTRHERWWCRPLGGEQLTTVRQTIPCGTGVRWCYRFLLPEWW